MSERFKFIKAFRNGHRFYTDGETGRIGVADQSCERSVGRFGTPEDTDDGILWLDFSRVPEYQHTGWGEHFSFPIIKAEANGLNSYSTPCSESEYDWLNQTFYLKNHNGE